MRREIRKRLGLRRTVDAGQFLKASASICDPLMQKIRKTLGSRTASCVLFVSCVLKGCYIEGS